jgi:hypothetical protein
VQSQYFKAMRKLILILILSLLPINQARAECTNQVCIDVYTENGQLVIEGKRNGATSSPTPRVASTIVPKPRPTSTRKYTYRPRTATPKPRNTTNSLADKVLQALPTYQVAYQPQGKVLTKLPVVFWSDLPTYFNKDFRILGQKVSVNLKPKSVWSFGDGSILVTSKVGKPYPSTEITHSYSVPGTYTVIVNSFWDGSFTVDGVVFPIKGSIKQVTAVDVKVVGASTKFVGK